MADKTITTFPKIGTAVAKGIAKSQSARPQRGILRPRGVSEGGMLAAATANHRPNIQERLGAKLAPQVTLYAPNAASAGDLQRNTVIVPSAMGNRDFFLRRRYGQGV